MENKIQGLQKIIDKSNYIVALTGAGISTSAGIPDFRGKNGVYNTGIYDPFKTFEYSYFKKDPSHFFKFAKEFAAFYDKIIPTEGHKFLARLEEKGKLKAIITQNIDGLHQIAGAKNVIEVHGGFTESHCISCKKKYDFLWMREELKNKDKLVCTCGKWVKPDIVFFGEAVIGMEEAQNHSINSDLFLVLGSSLTVQPAGFLPYLTGGKVVIINIGEVAFPEKRIYIHFNENIDEIVKNIII